MLAAHRAHLREVVIPVDNVDDLEEINEEVRKDMKFVMAATISEVLEIALLKQGARPTETARRPKAHTRTVARTRGHALKD